MFLATFSRARSLVVFLLRARHYILYRFFHHFSFIFEIKKQASFFLSFLDLNHKFILVFVTNFPFSQEMKFELGQTSKMGLEFDQSEYLVEVLMRVLSNRMQNRITQPCDKVLKLSWLFLF